MELDEIVVSRSPRFKKTGASTVDRNYSGSKKSPKFFREKEAQVSTDGRASSLELSVTTAMIELTNGTFEPTTILAKVREHLGSGLPESLYHILTASAFLRELNPNFNSFGDSPDLGTKEYSEYKKAEDTVLQVFKPENVDFLKWSKVVRDFGGLNEATVRKHLKGGLSSGQKDTLDKLVAWVLTKDCARRFFVLKGYAGAGKTFVLRRFLLYLDLLHPEIPSLFTAPTNKATKVLKEMVDKKAITIYSALKLSMSEEEDEQVLTAGSEESIDIPRNSLVGVDEASMLNAYITGRLDQVAHDLELKVLLVGDPAQLRPVKEYSSPAWDLTSNPLDRAFLKEILRFDNQLLALSQRIRNDLKAVIDGEVPTSLYNIVLDDNDSMSEGVFRIDSPRDFEDSLVQLAFTGGVRGFKSCKVIAWRNKTVDEYNQIIRKALGFHADFNEGELIMLAAPLTVDVNGRRAIVAHVDDEFEISSVSEKLANPYSDLNVTVPGCGDIPYFEVSTVQGQKLCVTPASDYSLDDTLQVLATLAKRATGTWKQETDWGKKGELNIRRKQLWKEYWSVRKFFTPVRYGYAITSHRAQGSTYDRVFVDARDIFSNPDKEERLQSLYVAFTRPSLAAYFV